MRALNASFTLALLYGLIGYVFAKLFMAQMLQPVAQLLSLLQ